MIVQLRYTNGDVISLNVAPSIIGSATSVIYKGKTFGYGGLQGLGCDTVAFDEVNASVDLSLAEVTNEVH